MQKLQSKAPWIICPTCSGDGKHSRNLGSFSADQFNAEFSDDEQEAYFSGAYDSRCDTCNGSGKVRDEEEFHERHEHQLRAERIADCPEMAWLNEY